MEQIVTLVRDYMHAEADADYPLLRKIPSTRATACFDYLEGISPAEREELLDARARVTALGFVLTPAAQQEILQLVDSNPAINPARVKPTDFGLQKSRYSNCRRLSSMLDNVRIPLCGERARDRCRARRRPGGG